MLLGAVDVLVGDEDDELDRTINQIHPQTTMSCKEESLL